MHIFHIENNFMITQFLNNSLKFFKRKQAFLSQCIRIHDTFNKITCLEFLCVKN